MLVLTVISYNGNAADALSANFDERGGVIGRADNSHMVLPDAERTVSRKHAQVIFRNGAYLIVDHGSNPIAVNGHELGKGHERAIVPGDTVQVGGYLMRVQAGQATPAAAAADPFADLFGDKTMVRPASPTLAPPAFFPTAPAVAPAVGNPLIPDDWDPFGATPAAAGFDPFPSRNATAAAPAPSLTAQLVQSSEDSLEKLFGLGGASESDPLAAGPLAQGPALPNTAGDTDPLRALQRSAPASRPPIPDDFPDLKTPWEERAQTRGPAPAPAPTTAPQAVPAGAVLSWEQTTRSAVAPPAPSLDAGLTEAAVWPPSAAPLRPAPAAPAMATAMGPPSTPAVPAQSADVEALLAALMEGLDVPALRLEALTPSLMFRLGALLRASTRGTVDLLAARAALKREVRAEVTMIVMRENNPLKFSPTVETALQHLLGPVEKGFTPPIAAMQDAFDDLRAHQIGVIAGMRAALEGVLARFDPAQMESRLVPRTGLAGLLPANRQARLWASFEVLHAQLASEAEDAFHALFGAAFLQAYEAHIDQLKRDTKPE